MRPTVYWISLSVTGRLAIMPRPRGNDWLFDEMRTFADTGCDTVVSLLTPSEEAELGLAQELEACQANSLNFLSFPICDRQTPDSLQETITLVQELVEQLQRGKVVVIHCRMGIGRSALIAESLSRFKLIITILLFLMRSIEVRVKNSFWHLEALDAPIEIDSLL